MGNRQGFLCWHWLFPSIIIHIWHQSQEVFVEVAFQTNERSVMVKLVKYRCKWWKPVQLYSQSGTFRQLDKPVDEHLVRCGQASCSCQCKEPRSSSCNCMHDNAVINFACREDQQPIASVDHPQSMIIMHCSDGVCLAPADRP